MPRGLLQTRFGVRLNAWSCGRTRRRLLPFEDGYEYAVKVEKRARDKTGALSEMAEPTGLEPATSDVTVQLSNIQNSPKLLMIKIFG